MRLNEYDGLEWNRGWWMGLRLWESLLLRSSRQRYIRNNGLEGRGVEREGVKGENVEHQALTEKDDQKPTACQVAQGCGDKLRPKPLCWQTFPRLDSPSSAAQLSEWYRGRGKGYRAGREVYRQK